MKKGVRELKNRWTRAYESLKGNRGSGIILVFVAISCITLMTTSLMFLSYTAFKMKVAERQNKVEFYEVDARADVFVAKLQNVVSDALPVAQREILENYENYRYQRNEKFQEVLIRELSNKLKQAGSCNTTFMTNLLGDRYVRVEKDSYTTYNEETSKVIIRNIDLIYTSADTGNSTTITTDIIIDISGLQFTGEWDIEGTVTLENWSVN